jgi:hypothetical protein
VAVSDQFRDDGGADEAGATSDEDVHVVLRSLER